MGNLVNGDSEPENSDSTMEEEAKEFLKKDKITLEIVRKFFS